MNIKANWREFLFAGGMLLYIFIIAERRWQIRKAELLSQMRESKALNLIQEIQKQTVVLKQGKAAGDRTLFDRLITDTVQEILDAETIYAMIVREAFLKVVIMERAECVKDIEGRARDLAAEGKTEIAAEVKAAAAVLYKRGEDPYENQ